ncbi:MAG: CHAT domain-containing protein [Actinomycetota bacterium]
MSEDAGEVIRSTVELLRAGPPHNQLLSPLTQYLGVCDDSGAVVVNLPFEHVPFERRMRSLRYDPDVDPSERNHVLREMGAQLAELLSGIPGVSSRLAGRSRHRDDVVHLRVVLSASELSLLPYELAKLPVHGADASDQWLSLQSRPQVCVTRHIRSVGSYRGQWPDRPRILFVSGKGDRVPFEEHRAVLRAAVAPWVTEGRPEDYWLTVIENASVADVREAMEQDDDPYAIVHVLAHGAEDDTEDQVRFGIELADVNDAIYEDVVSGERFASALTAGERLPAAVVLSSCDSAQQGGIEVPGASFAHALHAAGVPFVVGSQFPLTEEGSIPLTEVLYDGMLWGEHPIRIVADARRRLHTDAPVDAHDWGSLVVYEALPDELDERLETVRYRRARTALDAALESFDRAVEAARDDVEAVGDDLAPRIEELRGRLPARGPYAAECRALSASSRKRQAEATYRLGEWRPDEGEPQFAQTLGLLHEAFDDYSAALRKFIVIGDEPFHRAASLHWVAVQTCSLGTVLDRPLLPGCWETAHLSATEYLEHENARERGWAHGSLIELWLLKLTEAGIESEHEHRRTKVAEHVDGLTRLDPALGSFMIASTRRQLDRYHEWWGAPGFFTSLGLGEREEWRREGGIVDTAREMSRKLTPLGRR